MLFTKNGEDLNVYNDLNRENNNSDAKKFTINNFIVKISKKIVKYLPAIFIGLSIGVPIGNFIVDGVSTIESTFYENNKSELEKPNIIYSTPEDQNLNLESIDYQEAIELINSSFLSDVQKEIATNETLLKDVFEYYKGNNMEYVIKSRLDGLKTESYSKEKGIKNGNIGYYSTFSQNVLYIREDVEGEDTFKHEYIHLLQSGNHEYSYLVEATAEIVSYEYLDAEISSYHAPINNTKLLMDTIGPKVIWETVFGGDDTNLVNTLKNNLNETEAEELISYLKQKPKKIDEENKHERIKELISNLYRNINLKDIREDINIYGIHNLHIDKIYFNEEKMQESFLNIDCSKAQELGLVTPIYDELYLKEISKEEYDKLNMELQNNPEYQKLKDDFAFTNLLINIDYQNRSLNKIKNIEVQYIPTNENVSVKWSPFSNFIILKNKIGKCGESYEEIEEALEKGLIIARYYEIVNEKNLTEIEKANYICYSNILVDCEISNEKAIVNYDENGILKNIKYMVPTIKEMFPDQTIRINDNNMIR